MTYVTNNFEEQFAVNPPTLENLDYLVNEGHEEVLWFSYRLFQIGDLIANRIEFDDLDEETQDGYYKFANELGEFDYTKMFHQLFPEIADRERLAHELLMYRNEKFPEAPSLNLALFKPFYALGTCLDVETLQETDYKQLVEECPPIPSFFEYYMDLLESSIEEIEDAQMDLLSLKAGLAVTNQDWLEEQFFWSNDEDYDKMYNECEEILHYWNLQYVELKRKKEELE